MFQELRWRNAKLGSQKDLHTASCDKAWTPVMFAVSGSPAGLYKIQMASCNLYSRVADNMILASSGRQHDDILFLSAA